eukprot:TRINITY_DN37456_c0_g1_i1.p1 TRINITY_DN37456_c0_g1~~TRINITY_DN37456_c0_g1_i1.p1  ORF type:complete len:148 (+),score=43.70 TRINITY_DN37456_c0_g1_i1:69-512(+)
MLPFIDLICFAAQYLFPGYETCRALVQEETNSIEITQWTVYWVLCISFMMVEQNLLGLLAEYFPLYLELKALVILWLVHPEYKGALWLWWQKLKDLHKPLDEEFYPKLMQALGPLGEEAVSAAPAEAAKAAPGAQAAPCDEHDAKTD